MRSSTRPSEGDVLKRRSILGLSSGCVALLAALTLAGLGASPSTRPAVTTFDPDPNHIWNRTYSCLFLRQDRKGRQFGADSPDPLLWFETRHLLTGDSHRKALACLDEFLNSHAERAVHDPLKHAILQHDLWAIFDWAAAEGADDFPEARAALESRLALAIRRLALSPDEIRSLPDTYTAAVGTHQLPAAYDSADPHRTFLPPDLFQPDGPWFPLSAYLDEPTAVVHFTGRSRFLIFIRLPAGRAATLAYVNALRRSAEPPLVKKEQMSLLNLALPQFPEGTQVALVRQAIVMNSEGNLVPTSLTETVQFRRYHSITPGSEYTNYINGPASHDQDFFEFHFSRSELFAGHAGGLVAIQPADVEFPTFATHGIDSFESPPRLMEQGKILARCFGCHSDSGIHSVQSRLQWLRAPQGPRPADDDGTGRRAVAWETAVTIARKKQQPDFKLLQEMWRRQAITDEPRNPH